MATVKHLEYLSILIADTVKLISKNKITTKADTASLVEKSYSYYFGSQFNDTNSTARYII